MSKLKLQIMSDTHLEFRGDPKFFKPRAPILCLLGDICACGTTADFKTFVNFLKEIHPKFEKIIHVAGNHEYYAGRSSGKKLENTYEGINAKLSMLKRKFPKYIFMYNNIHKMAVGKKMVYIVGTTLWSYIPVEKRKLTATLMNDYNMLFKVDEKDKTKTRRWTVADTVVAHRNSVALIRRAASIATKNGVKCILLTHHKPIMDGKKTPEQHCYESDLVSLLKDPFVLSAHGHTHEKYSKKINGCLTISNPRGYPGEHTRFDPNFCVELRL